MSTQAKLQGTMGGLMAAVALLQALLFVDMQNRREDYRHQDTRIDAMSEMISFHEARLTSGGFDAQQGMELMSRVGRIETKLQSLPPKQIEINREDIRKLEDRVLKWCGRGD